MPIEFLGGTEFRGQVGEPLPEPLAVQVRTESGKEVAGKVVTFTCDPPDALTLGTERVTSVKTGDDGIARIEVKGIRRFGRIVLRASVAADGLVPAAKTKDVKAEHAEATIEGFHPEVEVTNVNGKIIAIRRKPTPPPSGHHAWAWPVAAVLIALIVAGTVALLAHSGPRNGVAPTTWVDPSTMHGLAALRDDITTATMNSERANGTADAALRAAQQAPTREEMRSDLAFNSTTDRAYAAQADSNLSLGGTYDSEAFTRYLLRGRSERRTSYRLECLTHPDIPSCRRGVRWQYARR